MGLGTLPWLCCIVDLMPVALKKLDFVSASENQDISLPLFRQLFQA
jgi:hypothetical protein